MKKTKTLQIFRFRSHWASAIAKTNQIRAVIYILYSTLNGPRQAKNCLRTCAKSAGSHHPAHAQSITRAFARPPPPPPPAPLETFDNIQWFCMRSAKGLNRLHGCGTLLSAYVWRHVFAWRGSYRNFIIGQRRPWSDCADAQSDLGLRWPHMSWRSHLPWSGLIRLCFCFSGGWAVFGPVLNGCTFNVSVYSWDPLWY